MKIRGIVSRRLFAGLLGLAAVLLVNEATSKTAIGKNVVIDDENVANITDFTTKQVVLDLQDGINSTDDDVALNAEINAHRIDFVFTKEGGAPLCGDKCTKSTSSFVNNVNMSIVGSNITDFVYEHHGTNSVGIGCLNNRQTMANTGQDRLSAGFEEVPAPEIV